MNRKNKPARRGDLVVVQMAELATQDGEIEIKRCFLTLGRVTLANEKGTVMAYRRFGRHFVDREVPEQCAGVNAQRIDMQAIERDMTARIAKNPTANEFADLETLEAYLCTFMKETRVP
ncbi:hypothetical protein [Paraburkholderia adhaesiva]|uniref:hypothetical protein n=1 Tax=Paraburkholderia adhaesiva TaxID=2883244 RepID=UPI001F36B4A7|nr:hypothetical protein [Paraburkholderia adhaesiva]